MRHIKKSYSSKRDYKNTSYLFNYSSLQYIKIHSRMHPIEPHLKNFLGRAYPKLDSQKKYTTIHTALQHKQNK